MQKINTLYDVMLDKYLQRFKKEMKIHTAIVEKFKKGNGRILMSDALAMLRPLRASLGSSVRHQINGKD